SVSGVAPLLARRVGHDAVEPRREGRSQAEALDAAIGEQEAVLHDVVGQPTIAGEQIGEPYGGELVACGQRAQPGDIALLAAADGVNLRVRCMHVADSHGCPLVRLVTTTVPRWRVLSISVCGRREIT